MKDAPAKSGSPCSRKCCWTPFGTCSKHRNCGCHRAQKAADADAERIQQELERLARADRQAKTRAANGWTGMGVKPWDR